MTHKHQNATAYEHGYANIKSNVPSLLTYFHFLQLQPRCLAPNSTAADLAKDHPSAIRRFHR